MPDPAGRLLRALARSAAAHGCAPELRHETSRPWASITFTGMQHRIGAIGTGLDAWLAALPEADLAVPGSFVASCDVTAIPGGAVLTMLVLDA